MNFENLRAVLARPGNETKAAAVTLTDANTIVQQKRVVDEFLW
jgi:hypothetical protein